MTGKKETKIRIDSETATAFGLVWFICTNCRNVEAVRALLKHILEALPIEEKPGCVYPM